MKKQIEKLKVLLVLIREDWLTFLIALIVLTGVSFKSGGYQDIEQGVLTAVKDLVLSLMVAIFLKLAEFSRSLPNINSLFVLLKSLAELIGTYAPRDPKLGIVLANHVGQKIKSDFGGFIIGASSEEYINYINQLLPYTRKNFYATLRGGEKKPEYTLEWFFPNGCPPKNDDRNDRLDYLKNVNEAKIDEKIRIVLLEDTELEDFENPCYRKHFFEKNNNVEVYLISPSELIDYITLEGILKDQFNEFLKVHGFESIKISQSKITLTEKQCSFVYEDYAILDTIAIKHNGKNYLYYGVGDQIKYMLIPFFLIKHFPISNNEAEKNISWDEQRGGGRITRSLKIKKLTKEKIGNKTWNEFF